MALKERSVIAEFIGKAVGSDVGSIQGPRSSGLTFASPQYGDLNTDWTPTTVEWEVAFDFRIATAVTGTDQKILWGSGTGGGITLRVNPTGSLQFVYRDSGGGAKTLDAGARSDGERLTGKIKSSGTGVVLELDGVEVGSNSAVASGTSFNRINANATPAEYAGGEWYGLQFIDKSGIQNGIFLQGDASAQTYVDLGAGITLTGDFEISGSGRLNASNILRLFGNSDNFTSRLYVRHLDGAVVMTSPAGADITSPVGTVTVGQDFSYRCGRVGSEYFIEVDNNNVASGTGVLADFPITSILRQSTSYSNGISTNFNINNGEYIYLAKDTVSDNGDGTATARQTGSVAEFGAELFNGPVNQLPELTDNGDGSYTRAADFGWGSLGLLNNTYTDIGSYITVAITLSAVTGANPVSLFRRNDTDTANVSIPLLLGENILTIPVEAKAVGVSLVWIDSLNSGFTVSDISVKQTTNAIVQNFTAANNLIDVPNNTRNHRCDEASGDRLHDSYDPTVYNSYDFNGDSYMTVPEIALGAGYRVELDFIAPVGGYGGVNRIFIDNTDRDTQLFVNNVGSLTVAGGNYTIDGSSSTIPPSDGLTHHVIYTSSITGGALETFGSRFDGTQGTINFPIYNVRVYDDQDTLIHHYPMNNGQVEQPDVVNVRTELVVNGSFIGGEAGWTYNGLGLGAVEYVAGKAILTGSSFSNRSNITQNIPTIIGSTYRIRVKCDQQNGAYLLYSAGGSNNPTAITEAATVVEFVADTTSTEVQLRSQGGVSVFDHCFVTRHTEGTIEGTYNADNWAVRGDNDIITVGNPTPNPY